jgi:hypothetical protein
LARPETEIGSAWLCNEVELTTLPQFTSEISTGIDETLFHVSDRDRLDGVPDGGSDRRAGRERILFDVLELDDFDPFRVRLRVTIM